MSKGDLTPAAQEGYEAPAGVENIAAGKDGTLYFSCGTDLYRLRR